MRRSPDVVLFIVDQMQYQRQGRLDPIAVTPAMDRLAEDGVFFTHAYAANAQCVPSRAAMQTGRYPHQLGVMTIYGFGDHTGHLDDTVPTLGTVFRDAGYETAYFGKTHFGFDAHRLGYDHVDEIGVGEHLEQVDEEITTAAERWLTDRTDDRPFLMIVAWHQPHPPFTPVRPWYDDPRLDALELPRSYYDDDLSTKPAFQRRPGTPEAAGDEQAALEELRRYYSMIAHVDTQVARVRAALEQAGRWDEAVWMFTGDHGDMMGAHGLRMKGPLPYDEIFRIPLVLRTPSLSWRRDEVDDLVVNTSVASTLIAAAGIDVPSSFEGPSLLGLAPTDAPPADEGVFMEHYSAYWGLHPLRMIRTRAYKYVHYYGPDACDELYDLVADPGECCNIACDPAMQTVRADLRARVDTWWESTGGLTVDEYESHAFKAWGEATLVRDNFLWREGGHLEPGAVLRRSLH